MSDMDAAEVSFELPPELRMLKESVRRFVDRELIPIERESLVQNRLKPELREKLKGAIAELGLAGFDVPQEYGGLGLGLWPNAWCGASLAAPSRCRHGQTICLVPT